MIQTLRFVALWGLILGLNLAGTPRAFAQQGDFQWAQMPAQGGVLAGTGICPVRQGNALQCLLLYCTGERALHLSAYWTGAGVPGDAVSASVTLDGTVMLQGPMTRFETAPPGVEVGLPITADDYDRIAVELMSGRFLSMAINDGAGSLTIGAPLAGIRAGLIAARDTCDFATPPPIPDPVALARAEEQQACAAMGAQVTFDADFTAEQDLNADGRPDLVINRGGATCVGMGRINCGSAGCPQEFFIAVEGGYAHLGGGYMQSFEAAVKPIITLYLHGSSCGRVGVQTCIVTYEVTPDNRMIEIGRN